MSIPAVNTALQAASLGVMQDKDPAASPAKDPVTDGLRIRASGTGFRNPLEELNRTIGIGRIGTAHRLHEYVELSINAGVSVASRNADANSEIDIKTAVGVEGMAEFTFPLFTTNQWSFLTPTLAAGAGFFFHFSPTKPVSINPALIGEVSLAILGVKIPGETRDQYTQIDLIDPMIRVTVTPELIADPQFLLTIALTNW
jgi:hypothetical protein